MDLIHPTKSFFLLFHRLYLSLVIQLGYKPIFVDARQYILFFSWRYIQEKIFNAKSVTLKSIFHCNAKPLVLGSCVGLDPQRHNFTLPIPTCKAYIPLRRKTIRVGYVGV